MTFDKSHEQVLIATLNQPAMSWAGRVPRRFADSVARGLGSRLHLPTALMSRSQVKSFCMDPANSDEACFLVVSAWGGMRVNNARACWKSRRRWRKIIAALRAGCFSRSAAFDQFKNCVATGNLKGMGPAYFTKLIFFCRPNDDIGYIMDQHTVTSIHVLLQQRYWPAWTPIYGKSNALNSPTRFPEEPKFFTSVAPRLSAALAQRHRSMFRCHDT